MKCFYLIGIFGLVSGPAAVSFGAESSEGSYLASMAQAKTHLATGQYFKAARAAFLAIDQSAAPVNQARAYSVVTQGLIRAGLFQAGSYFFIRTLQMDDPVSIRQVLSLSEVLLNHVGGDLLRTYLIKHTVLDDYDLRNRNAILYLLGKEALQKGKEKEAISHLTKIQSKSPLRPYALQMRGTAYAILNQPEGALRDFGECVSRAREVVGEAAAKDLHARCLAGRARTYYQMERFAEAERVYDQIPKASFVWTDILFEMAWSAFSKKEYNRTLGRLVSYKSPALSFVFNSEIDVLAAQTYLEMCLYSDANKVVNEFNSRYAALGIQVKQIVEKNAQNLPAFYEFGKKVLGTPLHQDQMLYKMMNRFVRMPYFQNLTDEERKLATEGRAVRFFEAGSAEDGFTKFIDVVLAWRLKTIRILGGAFIKNSLMDYHSALLEDFDKIAFIKLEMLKLAKDKLVLPVQQSDVRQRGGVEPRRRDDQYYWGFNGEFWNDELGEYVFGLESNCHS